MTAPAPPEATCRAWCAAIRAHHPADLAALAQLGIAPVLGGRNNAVYRCADGTETCCVKVYRTDGRRRDEREWRALAFLAAHRPGLAPRPFHREPDPDLPIVAMEWLPGEPLLGLPRDDRRLAALAARLGELHALTPADGDFPDEAEASAAKILARVGRWAADGPPNVRAPLGRWLAGDDPARLGTPAPPVFGVADPNLANWLWDEATGALRRVDLEYAGWSDLASELADLAEGPWARALPDADWLAFARGFPALDWGRFAAARRLFALFWVGLFAERGDDRLDGQIARATALLEGR